MTDSIKQEKSFPDYYLSFSTDHKDEIEEICQEIHNKNLGFTLFLMPADDSTTIYSLLRVSDQEFISRIKSELDAEDTSPEVFKSKASKLGSRFSSHRKSSITSFVP
jgi:hypothetical protein